MKRLAVIVCMAAKTCLQSTLVGEWLVVFGEEFLHKGSPAPTKFKAVVCW
jgi:hypothetical protein